MKKRINFYQKTSLEKPSSLLLSSFEVLPIDCRTNALDLGCGSLVDSKFLATRFEKVVSVDKNAEVVNFIDPKITNLNLVITRLQDFEYLPNEFDLIHARFSLFFLGGDDFYPTWQKIVHSLKPGGIFVGQLLGEKDEWKIRSYLIFHTYAQAKNLLESSNLKILKLVEVEESGLVNINQPKFWHFFNIIAQKPKIEINVES